MLHPATCRAGYARHRYAHVIRVFRSFSSCSKLDGTSMSLLRQFDLTWADDIAPTIDEVERMRQLDEARLREPRGRDAAGAGSGGLLALDELPPWLAQPEWETGVALAHRVFGGLAICLLISWCTLLLFNVASHPNAASATTALVYEHKVFMTLADSRTYCTTKYG